LLRLAISLKEVQDSIIVRQLIGSDDLSNRGNFDNLESPFTLFANTRLVKCDFSYGCAAFDKILTDYCIVRGAVLLRLSCFLLY